MRFITQTRPSPALVVAGIALLVALAGTSAAAVALVPKNSVGSAQVIDGSLQSNDFRAGQVLGGSEAFSRSIEGPVVSRPLPDDSLPTIASLQIPKPGAYMIWATAQVESANVGGQCDLIAHGTPNSAGGIPDASREASISEGGSSVTLWTTVAHGFASTGGSVDLQCGGVSKQPSQVRKIKITAFRLAGTPGS